LQLGDSKIEKNCCTPCCTFFSKGVKHHYRYTPICPGFPQRSQLNKVKVFRVFTRLRAAFPVLFRFSRLFLLPPKVVIRLGLGWNWRKP
jgi:hypothetical protein